ncbi:MAG TPA: hypothetical protein VJN93_09310 [Candidatus Acidoferrum sp.]|nr:hypothetical protein [Candidatus Acidoferrum sp.]
MKRKAIRLLIWVLLLICLVPAAAMARTLVVRWQAKNFLQDVMHIRVGESDLAELQTLASKYRGYAVQGSPRCDQDLCTFDFYFDNFWLGRIGLARGTRFGGGITALGGKIAQIELFVQSDTGCSTEVVESRGTPDSTAFKVGGIKRTTFGGVDYTITMTIHLTSAASEQERQKAYNFNLACLTALRGCNDARQMLPGAW